MQVWHVPYIYESYGEDNDSEAESEEEPSPKLPESTKKESSA